MIRKILGLIFLALFAFCGFYFGHRVAGQKLTFASKPDKEYPLTERKSFVFLVYAHNQARWCEKSLRSLFEQDYDHYRVVFIDDASTDRTLATAQEYIQENNQGCRTQILHHETRLGMEESMRQAVDQLLDKEIAVPLQAKDWLVSNNVLTRINLLYQNPHIWTVSAPGLAYPAYEESLQNLKTFYAALEKKGTLKEKVEGHVRTLPEPLILINEASAVR